MAKHDLSPTIGAAPPPADCPGGTLPSVPPGRLFEDEMRARLLENIERIRQTLQYDDSEPEREPDPFDEVARQVREEINISVRRCLIASRNDMRRALEDMELGCYGRCQECGSEISRRRLEAAPWARFCVPCQDRMEKNEFD